MSDYIGKIAKTYKTSKHKSNYPIADKVIDAASTTGIGSAAGLAIGSGISRIVNGPSMSIMRMAHPNEQQLVNMRKALAGKIRGFNSGVAGAAIGGGLGLAYGLRHVTRDDAKPLPDAVQIPGSVALAGVGYLGMRNRGKILATLKGHHGRVDMFRGYDDPMDMVAKKEPWISRKRFKAMDEPSVVINEELAQQLRQKNKMVIPKSTGKRMRSVVNGKNIDDVWDDMHAKKSPYIRPIGGDPEGKIYMRMGNKRMEVDVNPDFTGRNISGEKLKDYTLKTKDNVKYEATRDMSVGGIELATAPEENPTNLFGKFNVAWEDVKKRLGKGYDYTSPAVGPTPGKSKLREASRKMGGGHIHLQFPKDDTLKFKQVGGKAVERTDDEIREVLARRAAFVSMPFDMTNKSMPYRSGLYARSKDTFNEPYGVSIVSERTMRAKPSWTPDEGYINFEHRVSPTYLGSDPKVSGKKVKLMQIINSNPEMAKSVDDAMDEIVDITKNETQYLHLPEVRERVIERYRDVLAKGGIKDADVDNILDTYMRGGLTKTSEDTDKSKRKINPLLAASIAAPIAAFAGYKFFRRLPKKLTPVQRASRDGLTITTLLGAKKKNRLLNKILISPDINYEKIRGSGSVGNQVYRGTVYHKNWTNDMFPISRVSGDVTINPPTMHPGRLRVIDKDVLHKLPGIGKMFNPATTLGDLFRAEGYDLKQIAQMSDDKVDDIIKSINTKYYSGRGFIKPLSGERMGKGTEQIYAPLEKARTHRLKKPEGIIGGIKHRNKAYLAEHNYGLGGIKSVPESYIVQENLNPNGVAKEFRIHMMNDKVIDSVRRFGALEGMPSKLFKNPAEKKEFESAVREMYKGIPEFSNFSDKRQVGMAFDAVRDAAGKLRLIEVNPNSGFLFPSHSFSTKPFDYYSTHTMYKHLTGRDSGFIAGLKGGAIGAGAGTAAAVGASQYNKKHAEEKGKNKYSPYIVGAAAGIGAGALAYLISKKPWKKGVFYDVVPNNWTKPNKWMTKGDYVRTSRDNIVKNYVVGPQDVVYANHPMRFLSDEHAPEFMRHIKGARRINHQKRLTHLMDKIDTYTKLPTYSKHLPAKYDMLGPDEMDKIKVLTETKRLNDGITEFNAVLAKKNNLSPNTSFFIKEKDGLGSYGTFFNSEIPSGNKKSRSVLQYLYDKKTGGSHYYASPAKNWKEVTKSPGNFIVQEALPAGREFRVQTLNGKIVKVIPRHGVAARDILPRSGLSKKQYSQLSEYVKKIDGTLKTDLGARSTDTFLGHDIIIPNNKKLGPRLIETNTQDGYHNMRPNALFRQVMGKDTKPVAIRKAIIAGVPTAIAGGTIKHESDKRHK